MKLSLCIAAYNEEKNIHIPLDSAYDLVDEVVIVDGSSTDKTVEIAKSYGEKVKVFVEDNPVMFHINKQKAIEKAKGEWILQLDADEALSAKLREEIIDLLQIKNVGANFNSPLKRAIQESPLQKQYVAFYIPRKNFFLNRFLTKGGVYPDYTIRLYKNGAVRFPCKNVHENVELVSTSEILSDRRESRDPSESIGYLKNPILHYESPTFSRYLKRWDRYTTLEAMRSQQLNFFSYLFIKPSGWFFKTYFRHLGLVDGIPGFLFSFFSSIRFWAIYVKWLKIKK